MFSRFWGQKAIRIDQFPWRGCDWFIAVYKVSETAYSEKLFRAGVTWSCLRAAKTVRMLSSGLGMELCVSTTCSRAPHWKRSPSAMPRVDPVPEMIIWIFQTSPSRVIKPRAMLPTSTTAQKIARTRGSRPSIIVDDLLACGLTSNSSLMSGN